MGLFDQVRASVQAVGESLPTTEQTLGDLLAERERIAAQMLELAANGSFGEEIIGYDDFGSPIMGQSGDSKQLGALADTFDILGDLAKTGDGSGGLSGAAANVLSANTAAQIAQQDRQLAESMRQFDISEARQGREFSESLAFNREELATTEAGAMSRLQASIASEEKRAAEALREEQRRNNLSSTLDMLTNQIKVGEIGVAEASNRISAATNAAQIQRDILADHAGKALPAGTKHFPNLGPNGPIAAMAGALGQPFRPFETMGTFGIDPNAIAAPISSAPGNSMLPGLDAQVAAAAQALAGMGVPLKDDGGPVRGPYVSVGPEMHIPTGNGAMTIPLNDPKTIAPAVGGAMRNFMTSRGGQPSGMPAGQQGFKDWYDQQTGRTNSWTGSQWSGEASAPQGGMPVAGNITGPQLPPMLSGIVDWIGARPQQWTPAAAQDWMAARPQFPGMPGQIGIPQGETPTQVDGGYGGGFGGAGGMLSGIRPEILARLQQVLAGYGVVPPTTAGSGARPPQVGLQNIAAALAGV